MDALQIIQSTLTDIQTDVREVRTGQVDLAKVAASMGERLARVETKVEAQAQAKAQTKKFAFATLGTAVTAVLGVLMDWWTYHFHLK